jgi:methionyl-tRNA formyltransferase
MRTVLVGAVETSRVALETLGALNAPPTALLTLPVERAARHSDFVDLRPLAERLDVPVIAQANVNSPDALAALREVAPDYVMVIGWSQICRQEFLALPRLGGIGYHPAPLPENRGRAVMPWTILQRVAYSGSTLFWLDEGVDSGDILVQERFAVAPDETAASIYRKHTDALRRLLAAAVPALASGDPPRVRQDHSRATYCAKRTAADGLIDWRESADDVWTLIRAAGEPYPGAFTFHGGRKVVIWEAEFVGRAPYWGLPGQIQGFRDGGALVQCGDREHILIRRVQPEGEAECAPQEFMKQHDTLGLSSLDLLKLTTGGGGQ